MQDLFNKIISYHDLINGDLTPNKLRPTAIANFLKSEQLTCKDMIVGHYRGHKVVSQIKVSSANPIAHKFYTNKNSIQHQVYFNSKYQGILESINNTAFKSMTILEKIVYETPISMPTVTDWNEIENDRLRYCYFNQLLENLKTEHIYEIRQITLIDDEETCKKKISKLHRLLNSFLIELTDRYKIKQADLTLQLKHEYTNRDCAILIYISIVEILDHTYKSFKRYLDLSLNIPFSSKLINNTNFITKTRLIERKLNALTVDEELKDILNAELKNILKFQNTKRISYNDYQYYTVVFKSLKRFFLKRKIKELDQEKIVTYLISINFKNKSFFDYLIESIISASNDFEELEERNNFLQVKTKEFEQLKVLTSGDQENCSLINKLLNWLALEIKHIESDIISKQNQLNEFNTDSIKLISTLNINEIALLFRLLNELDIFEPEKRVRVAAWIKQSITNKDNRIYSQSSLRNNMYNPSTASIDRIKKFAIELKRTIDRLDE
ncbi:hypothetical protein [Brumimicrobium aurantiacum]|uniref:Uncharacterized protein n=1 Tax=Brumimicrobium aurantiacum TaxID=1737063 RepID=A0A3E1EUE7_9FLAO|nr:hypothetical protein [Brumimicrobium aurantiacum]RFC53196.1 hypothetical protein DXU93_14095 [Brumimicrobium aurantiacum]